MNDKIQKKRSRFGKKAVSLSLAAALSATAFGGLAVVSFSDNSVKAADYALADSIQEGTILHCFDWKYSDIIQELPNIAKAGFSSVQVSPIQPHDGKGAWYWLFQPTDFAAGNELGSANDLKELCSKAHEYGINIVMDVVANHLAGNHNVIRQDLVPDQYWHHYGEIKSYKDRNQVIYGDLGMQDLNSEDEYVQNLVADYIDVLKGLGVDGIRWDAAKHIGLPSEGCNFWSAVTNSGLYNYGEILDKPCGDSDQALELMNEYTKYISVTDDSIGGGVLDAFKKGKAYKMKGGWASKGIDMSKIVYWAESHDTYSNKENAGTNNVSQNLIDRTYAVVAAMSDATSLYLSRPEATKRDSIRIGVKGSMHFTSDEVAAVNHFHNAMVGKNYAYAASDNCSVVTRDGGGAVIVSADEGREVTVENVKGYVAPGTYIDEVTGNEFVVTDTTIKGKVGSSGIAVVYDSQFTSKVTASLETGSVIEDTADVTLRAIGVTDAKFSTSEGEGGDYTDGDVITIGKDTEAGKDITLTLTAKNADGEEVTATYKYTKKSNKVYPVLEAGGVVLDNTSTGWDKVNVYVYDESGSTTITNAGWPGVEATDEGGNMFSYILPEQFETCDHIMVIFNNGNGDQIPAAMQAGLTMKYTDKKFYDGTNWIDLPENPKEESEESEESQESETSDEDEQVKPFTTLGITGGFNNWDADVPMSDEDGDGIYEGIVEATGSYEFKVRADGTWDYSWSVYEPDYDRTQNSQTNCSVTVGEGQKLLVKLDTTRVDDAALAEPDSYVNDEEFNFNEEGYEYWPVVFEVIGEASEVSEESEVSEVSEISEDSEGSEDSAVSEISEVSEDSEESEESDVSGVSEVSEESDSSEDSEASDESVVSEDSEGSVTSDEDSEDGSSDDESSEEVSDIDESSEEDGDNTSSTADDNTTDDDDNGNSSYDDNDTVKTGDVAMAVVFVAIAAAALGAVVLASRKKTEE